MKARKTLQPLKKQLQPSPKNQPHLQPTTPAPNLTQPQLMTKRPNQIYLQNQQPQLLTNRLKSQLLRSRLPRQRNRTLKASNRRLLRQAARMNKLFISAPRKGKMQELEEKNNFSKISI